MCQFLDNITISGSGQIPVTFLEGREVDLYETAIERLQFFVLFRGIIG